MEWTDGMEYQLTKIAKTNHCVHGEVVSAVLPLLASTRLATVFNLILSPTHRMFCAWTRLCFGSVDVK